MFLTGGGGGSISFCIFSESRSLTFLFLFDVDSFEAQQWEQAQAFFKTVIDNAEDHISRSFFKRCTEMIETDADFEPLWNGVWDESYSEFVTEVYSKREFAEIITSTPVKGEKEKAAGAPGKLDDPTSIS
jgi:hypothetical protein